MSRSPIITAIDLGTDKCATLIATLDDHDQIQVIGVSVVPSRGLRKSAIVDLESALTTISESVDAAERMAGVAVKEAYVSITGAHIRSQNSKGVVAVASPSQEITRSDVDRVIEAARAISLPHDRTVIHVIPKDFSVDSQSGVKDPIGMTGIRLESETHIITGMTTALKNVEKCIGDAGIDVASFVFAGLATSEVVTTETERELGVVVVDIGAGSTSLCVFVDGTLQYSAALPIGARHITQDIALGTRISLESAEKIKLALSDSDQQWPQPKPGESKDDLAKRRKVADQLNLTELGIYEQTEELSKKTIIEHIMVPRMKEILSMVGDELHKHHLLDKVPAGLVLTGGGAQTVTITEVAKRTLRLPARIGIPQAIRGLTQDTNKPAFATCLGLLEYGRRYGGKPSSGPVFDFGNIFNGLVASLPTKKIGSGIANIFKSLLP